MKANSFQSAESSDGGVERFVVRRDVQFVDETDEAAVGGASPEAKTKYWPARVGDGQGEGKLGSPGLAGDGAVVVARRAAGNPPGLPSAGTVARFWGCGEVQMAPAARSVWGRAGMTKAATINSLRMDSFIMADICFLPAG